VFREPEFVAFHKKPQILLIGKVSEPEVHWTWSSLILKFL
jgi:hypothetical protein